MNDLPGHDPRFLPLLANFAKDELHNDAGTVYAVWSDFALAYFSLEWMRFSARNGGEPQISSAWTLGRCILMRLLNRSAEQLYRNEQGVVVRCSHCRRVRRAGLTLAWDWVPAWAAAQPPGTSHRHCEPCIGFHHPLERKRHDQIVKSIKTYC